jgi:hypothetical protein
MLYSGSWNEYFTGGKITWDKFKVWESLLQWHVSALDVLVQQIITHNTEQETNPTQKLCSLGMSHCVIWWIGTNTLLHIQGVITPKQTRPNTDRQKLQSTSVKTIQCKQLGRRLLLDFCQHGSVFDCTTCNSHTMKTKKPPINKRRPELGVLTYLYLDLLQDKGKKLRGFGPLANYADRATAASWWSSANFCG